MSPLPGGDFGVGGHGAFSNALAGRYGGIDPGYLNALAGRHGSLVDAVLGEASGMDDLGDHFGGGLHAREVDYLIDHEWAQTADDVLWRRTNAGLHMKPDGCAAVERYMMKYDTAS